jgi:ABC-type phosphate transport system permease subunit
MLITLFIIIMGVILGFILGVLLSDYLKMYFCSFRRKRILKPSKERLNYLIG